MKALIFLYNNWLVITSTLGITWLSVLAVIKFFGKKWIEEKISIKFGKEIEKYKLELNKELESFKVKTGTLLARTTKKEEKEFEILGELWTKLKIDEGKIHSILSPLQEYTNVSSMNERQLESFLIENKFNKNDKEEITSQSSEKQRQKIYQEKAMWNKLSNAEMLNSEYHNYVITNSPFIPKAIYKKAIEVSRIYREALFDYKTGQEVKDYKMIRDSYKKTFPFTDKLIEELAGLIQKRLNT